MKKIVVMLVLVSVFFIGLLTNCNGLSIKKLKPNGNTYPFIVCVENIDLNENITMSFVACDSFQMISDKECDIWSEGKLMKLKCNTFINVASQ